jgi:hypothetical protein
MTQVRIGDVTYNLRDWPTPDPAKCSVADLELGTITAAGNAAKLVGMSEGRWNLWGEGFREQPSESGTSKALMGLRGWFWLTDPTPLEWKESGEEDKRVWHSGAGNGDFRIRERHNDPYDEDDLDGTRYELDHAKHGWLSREQRALVFSTAEEAQLEAARRARDARTRRTS